MRVECCEQLLTRYNVRSNFEIRLITGDETWLYQCDLTTQQESMQWQRGQPAPVKVKAQVCCQGLGFYLLGCEEHYAQSTFSLGTPSQVSTMLKY